MGIADLMLSSFDSKCSLNNSAHAKASSVKKQVLWLYLERLGFRVIGRMFGVGHIPV